MVSTPGSVAACTRELEEVFTLVLVADCTSVLVTDCTRELATDFIQGWVEDFIAEEAGGLYTGACSNPYRSNIPLLRSYGLDR